MAEGIKRLLLRQVSLPATAIPMDLSTILAPTATSGRRWRAVHRPGTGI